MLSYVIANNLSAGMYAVGTDDGGCTVFELLGGGDVSVGDKVEGDLRSLGSVRLRDLTTGETLDVIIQNFDVSSSELARQLRQ